MERFTFIEVLKKVIDRFTFMEVINKVVFIGLLSYFVGVVVSSVGHFDRKEIITHSL